MAITKPNYRKLHNDSGIVIGDVVKVTREFKDFEEGCELSWDSALSKYIGKSFIVRYDKGLSGFGLYDAERGDTLFFPCSCLEKTNNRAIETRYSLFGIDITDQIPIDIRKKIHKYLTGQITGLNF